MVGMQRVEQAMPKLDQRLILKTLLIHSKGALTAVDRANPQVREIIKVAEGTYASHW